MKIKKICFVCIIIMIQLTLPIMAVTVDYYYKRMLVENISIINMKLKILFIFELLIGVIFAIVYIIKQKDNKKILKNILCVIEIVISLFFVILTNTYYNKLDNTFYLNIIPIFLIFIAIMGIILINKKTKNKKHNLIIYWILVLIFFILNLINMYNIRNYNSSAEQYIQKYESDVFINRINKE